MKDRNQRLAYGIDELAISSRVGRTFIYAAIARGDLVARKLGRWQNFAGKDVILAYNSGAFNQMKNPEDANG